MALVSGQTYFSASSLAELDTASYTEFTNSTSAEDSDDEYVYVSSLAERIAHAMLEEEEDHILQPELTHVPFPAQDKMEDDLFLKDITWPSLNSHTVEETLNLEEEELSNKGCPVSHYAAAWRDHGPTEWDCFYTPSLQQASKHSSSYYTTQIANGFPKHCRRFQGWNRAHLVNSKQARPCETGDLQSHKSRSTVYNNVALTRRESIGTGVFLPKIINSGSRYQRKAGSLSPKSAYAPRNKC